MQPKLFATLVLFAGLAIPQEVPAPAPQETHKIARGSLTVELEFEGQFDAVQVAHVRCRPETYQGELVVVEAVPHGRAVRKGDVLVRFETGKLQEQMTAAQNDAAAARAARDRAEEEQKLAERGDRLAMQDAERQARHARERLDLFERVDMPLEKREAEMGVQRYLDTVDDQREELDQLEKMYKSEELTNATAEIVVKRARRSLERAKASLEMTKERAKKRIEKELPTELDQHRASSENAAHQLDLLQKTQPHSRREKEAATVRARLELKRQEEGLQKLQQDLEALSVRAPADGVAYGGTFESGRWSGAVARR